ncbi:MAG: hypothetical protein DRI01_05800 [Chloroflexi bacterium]|nr:MAG: hypothetical protein DRI01_05800 [Chloroflexota bacterium]
MRAGHRTDQPRGNIDYKQLGHINPEAIRRAILEYLKSNSTNISQTALVLGINRTVVYDILRKEERGNLKNCSRAPRNRPRRTPIQVEDKVIETKCKTRYGSERLSRYLKQHEDLSVPPGTIRHIIRGNKDRISYLPKKRIRKEKRGFVDWYSAKPFEIVQVDLKYIRDQKALTRELAKTRSPVLPMWSASIR